MTDRKIEILAPAGSYAAFRAALNAGADAVYAGGARFGARAFAENFTEDELIQAIREAHFYGRKFYLTVNTLLKDREIADLYDYLAPFYKNGLDAVIVQDMGVVEYIRTYFPNLDIHASTQMTITGAFGAKFAESCGMTRVVPARELSLSEIRQIREQTGLEIECFVHGALCYCYSGQCLLSSLIGGRSGNRGQCAQPCRLPYVFDASSSRDPKYYLSPKDICTLEIIPDLVEAGIDSFKIEGRMKKPEYVAAVTAMYRKYADLYLRKGRKGFHVAEEDRRMLLDLYNRGGFSEGYYHTHNGREMISLDRPNHAGVPALKVRYQKGRKLFATVLTQLHPGDVLELAGGKNDHTMGTSASVGEEISFLVSKGISFPKGSVIRRIRNESLICNIRKDIIDSSLQLPADGAFILKVGEPAVLQVCSRGVRYQAESEERVQSARNQPTGEERIRAQLMKTGGSEFCFRNIEITMDRNVFMPIQQINAIRRDALAGLKEKILAGYERDNVPPVPFCNIPENSPETAGTNGAWTPVFSVSVDTMEQLNEVMSYIREEISSEKGLDIRRLYIDSALLSDAGQDLPDLLTELKSGNIETSVILPRIFRDQDGKSSGRFTEQIKTLSADSVLIRSIEEFQCLKEHGFDKKMILDHNLYVFNRYSRIFWQKQGVREFTAPAELNQSELTELDLSDCELEFYGYTPVMVSAQCILKTSGKCRKAPETHWITDRRGSRFPVRNYCTHCYNVVYNDRPLFLASEKDAVIALRPRMLRISFHIEDRKQVRGVLRSAADAFILGRDEKSPDFKYTQGHFRNGVR